MSEFFVRYHSRTPVSLITREEEQENPKAKMQYVFGEDITIDILNSFVVSGGDILHTGLDFDFKIKAQNRNSAINTTEDIADDLVSLLAFTTNTEISDAERVQTFCWEDRKDNKFTQNVLVQNYPVYTQLSPIDLNFYDSIQSLVYSDRLNESNKRKLMRSLYYYRKSLKAERAEDEFLNLFIALDAIEYILKDIYGPLTIKHKCGKCGEIAATDTDKASGRKSLYKESDHLEANFQEIRQARHELFHAGKRERAIDYVTELRDGFRVGIAAVLDIDIEGYVDQILGKKTTTLKDHELIFEGKLEEFDPSAVDDARDIPAVDAEIEFDCTVGNKGQLNTELSYSIEKCTPNDETIVADGLGYYSYGDIGKTELIEHKRD
ncbi:MAG: hypothetical protein U9O06_13100 [Euryarchaeota archaeon]|nr:hypothetical protein [Euryarchaeota archaeon]